MKQFRKHCCGLTSRDRRHRHPGDDNTSAGILYLPGKRTVFLVAELWAEKHLRQNGLDVIGDIDLGLEGCACGAFTSSRRLFGKPETIICCAANDTDPRTGKPYPVAVSVCKWSLAHSSPGAGRHPQSSSTGHAGRSSCLVSQKKEPPKISSIFQAVTRSFRTHTHARHRPNNGNLGSLRCLEQGPQPSLPAWLSGVTMLPWTGRNFQVRAAMT